MPLRLTAQWLLGAWVLFQIANLVLAADSQVAWIAHVGGLATPARCWSLFMRRKGVRFLIGIWTEPP